MEHGPERGFYYHYKHDPEGPEEHYAYEVVGTTKHTETGEHGVLYRPLYENSYLDADYSVRPRTMFMESVVKDGEARPRFTRITDPALIDRLTVLRDSLYPSSS